MAVQTSKSDQDYLKQYKDKLSDTARRAQWVSSTQDKPDHDGQTLATLDVAADCTQNGVVRCDVNYPIPVGAANSYVVVAAYGNTTMEPVMMPAKAGPI